MIRIVLGEAVLDARGVLINDARHAQALRRAQQALERAQKAVLNHDSLEFAAEDVKAAVNELDAITGRDVDADVLEHIFSKFCIGK